MILALYEGFFQNNFRWLFKVIFLFQLFGCLKMNNFCQKWRFRGWWTLSSLPVCFWKLHFSFHSATEIVAFFAFFHFFSRSQIIRNCNFFNKKSEKWYFFFNCDIFFLNVKFQKLSRKRPNKKKNITYGTKNITLENFKNVPIMAYFGIKKGISNNFFSELWTNFIKNLSCGLNTFNHYILTVMA